MIFQSGASMKNFLVAIMIAVVTLTAGMSDAEARRLGGGTYGRQSQNVSRQAPSPSYQQAARPAPAAPAPAAPQPAQPRPSGAWKGVIGGALLGLGLGSLMSGAGLGGLGGFGGGVGSGLGSLLMLGLLIAAGVWVYRMMRRSNANSGNSGMQHAYAGGTPEIGSRLESVEPTRLQPASTGSAQVLPWGVPSNFDSAGFLRHAKTCFIRLQAAWDKGDINDLREFTTPEMFAEFRLQLQERGASPNHTDVMSIEAELLGIETVGDEYLASVRFTGMIKEDEHAPAAPFTEVWNFVKPVSSGGWLLAGIQQIG
jgi:predicted lipid-binding transport protein (Tim44 family)